MQLTVSVSPQFSTVPPSNKTITEGDDLSIQCSAKGTPAPQVKWLHNGNILNQGQESATLNIVNIQRSQSGIYECQAFNNQNDEPEITTTEVIVHYPPEIAPLPANTTVTQGDNIVLNCQASASPPATILWSRDNNVPIEAKHAVSGGKITIPSAEISHAGKYVCTALNSYSRDGKVNRATAVANVTVQHQPSIVHHSRDQTVIETETLNLMCKANGIPVPTITWTKAPGTITPPNTGNMYTISSVQRSDAGTYTCTASNGIGGDSLTSIQVTVQYKPSINKASSSSDLHSWNNHTITLKCVVSSSLPSPDFTWYKPNGDVIPCNQCSKTVSSQVTVQTGQDSGDYGLYRCIATNVVGSDQHFINVTQLFPPESTNITVTDIEVSSVIIRWTKPLYDGGSEILQYKLIIDSQNYYIDAPDTQKFISGLTKNTKYEVKLYAKNIAGYGSASNQSFTTKKQGPPSFPEVEADRQLTSVTFNWSKPDENGGEITKYTIYKKVIGTDFSWLKVIDVTTTSYTIEDLVPGKNYSFILTATNQYGESLKDDRNAKIVAVPVENNSTNTNTTVVVCKDCSSARSAGYQKQNFYYSTIAGLLIFIFGVQRSTADWLILTAK